jgi:hypothetical protein
MDIVLENPQFVSQNLRVLVFALMPAVSSLRSGLAESALTCLREIASEFGEDVTPFFEPVVNHLFSIIASNRPAIARLAADCVSAVLVNIDRIAALEFLGRDHAGQPPEVREHIALCIDAVCGECDDPSQLLPAIAAMLLDPRDNTREHAHAALVQLAQKFEDLLTNSTLREMDQKRRLAVVNALDACPRPI